MEMVEQNALQGRLSVADPITDRRHSTTTDLQPQSHGKASGDAGHGERSWPRDDMEKWDMYGFRR
jgi:hypothetical protein